MRFIFKTALVTGLFFLFLTSTQSVFAQCTGFNVTPSVGLVTDTFEAHGYGCGEVETSLTLKVVDQSTADTVYQETLYIKDRGNIDYEFNLPRPGVYSAIVYGATGYFYNQDIITVLGTNPEECTKETVGLFGAAGGCSDEKQVCSKVRNLLIIVGYECRLPKISDPSCNTGMGGSMGIDTAIGCVPVDPNSLAAYIVRIGSGFAGVIALWLLALASFRILVSQGDPEKLAAGKSIFIAVISGLLVLALSVFIYRLIGSDLLGLFS